VIGQYRLQFDADCATVTFDLIHDDCLERGDMWGNGTTFTAVTEEEDTCRVISGVLSESSEAPQLSGEAFTTFLSMSLLRQMMLTLQLKVI
jgi:hypothetical protein